MSSCGLLKHDYQTPKKAEIERQREQEWQDQLPKSMPRPGQLRYQSPRKIDGGFNHLPNGIVYPESVVTNDA
jgi:hypothetical protein